MEGLNYENGRFVAVDENAKYEIKFTDIVADEYSIIIAGIKVTTMGNWGFTKLTFLTITLDGKDYHVRVKANLEEIASTFNKIFKIGTKEYLLQYLANYKLEVTARLRILKHLDKKIDKLAEIKLLIGTSTDIDSRIYTLNN